jgi:hypothetical protein
MNWTSEQLAEVERQRKADADARRFRGSLTDEQEIEYERLIQQEEAGREQVVRDSQPLRDALRETGFSGALRRAIVASGRSPVQLERETGCDAHAIHLFLRGEEPLPTDVVDVLIRTLGLTARLEVAQ